MTVKAVLLSTIAATLTLQALPAVAQDAAKGGEIIVTARKREESLLSVPVIEKALTQEQIDRYAVNDLYTVAQQVPGLSMGGAFTGAQVAIRGVGTSTVSSVIDQSVSLNLDGLQVTQGLAYAAGFFDLGQAEVLKGPQALFFGKNSPGGVISLRSADPTDDFELIARAGYEFEARERFGELIVSGPVSPALKLRLATHYSDMDGFFRNKAVAVPGLGAKNPKSSRYAPQEDLMLRGTVLFSPSSAYSARLKVNYAREDRIGGTGGQLGYCPEGIASTLPIPFINADENCKLDRVIRNPDFDPAAFPSVGTIPGIANNGVQYMKKTQIFGSLEQNLRLSPEMTLTSVTGYYKVKNPYLFDATGTSGTLVLAAETSYRQHDFTQELRLASDFSGSPVNFMAGVFYQDGRQENLNLLRTNTVILPFPLLSYARHVINIRSTSLFGQAIWNITPALELAGGARWTSEKRVHYQYNLLSPVPGPSDLLDPRIKSDNISPEVTLTYRPSNDLTVFAAYKQGFKSGSFNAGTTLAPTDVGSFGDEKVKGVEAGVKARLFDRSLTLNLAAYHYKYSDLQVGATELTATGGIVSRTINAASAKIYGAEIDLSYQPPAVEGLTLNFAANYNHARYIKFENAPCGNGQLLSEGCDRVFGPNPSPLPASFHGQDLSGRPLVRAPDWTFNFGLDYEIPVGRDLTLVLGSNTNYTSHFFNALIDRPNFEQRGFFKTSATVTLNGPEDKWQLALIGNNIGNKLTSGTCFNSNTVNGVFVGGGQLQGSTSGGPDGQDEAYCIVDRGREIWVRATFKL